MTMKLIATALSAALLTASFGANAQSSAADGRTLFQRQCTSCHQIANARNGIGPSLQGVAGRDAGVVAGFNYSEPLKASGIVWSRETLDKYLQNPAASVRGTKMTFRVANEAQRTAIIDFMLQPAP